MASCLQPDKHWRGAEVAPGSVETLDALRKRPAVPREVCPPELIRHRPEVLFALDEDHLNKNVRSAKRGAAGGPDGMTVESNLCSTIRKTFGCFSKLQSNWRGGRCLRTFKPPFAWVV